MSGLLNGRKMTITQQRILSVLADGEPHRRDELIACLQDDMADRRSLQRHLDLLRQKLRPLGHDIVAQLLRRQIYYRHIVTLKEE